MGVQPETYLQRGIKKLIRKRGGYAIKQHGSMISEPGIPDIIACYKGLFLTIEAKELNNIPSKQQGIHMRNIQSSNGITIVAWDILDVEQVLDIIDTYQYSVLPFIGNIKSDIKSKNIDTGEKW